MKILFLCDFFPDPEFGGVESVTATLAEEFVRMGHECYCVYQDECELGNTFRRMSSEVFSEVLFAQHKEVATIGFILRNGIQIAMVQSYRTLEDASVTENISSEGKCKVVGVLHSRPGYDKLFLREWLLKTKNRSLKEWVKKLHNRIFFRRRFAKRYAKISAKVRRSVEAVDSYVLLSPYFIPLFIENYRIPEHEQRKVVAIGNMLRYDVFATQEDIAGKRKEVLIVSRLHEMVKQISKALLAWQKVQQAGKLDQGWKLTIVGHGPDEPMYRKLVEELKLRNVSFEGRQEPLEYYRRAAISLHTSDNEGWGMTLTESQQMGGVPIVRDTYESLHDIVTDGFNGVLIDPSKDDVDRLASGTLRLMEDPQLRERMALNAVESSRKFDKRTIAGQWIDLFEQLLSSGR